MLSCFVKNAKNSIPVVIIPQADYPEWFKRQSSFIQQWFNDTQFRGEAGNISLIPDVSGKLQRVIYCISDIENFWGVGNLPLTLPEGIYQFDLPTIAKEKALALLSRFAIAWGLGSYQFNNYKKLNRKPAQLFLSDQLDPDIKKIAEIKKILKNNNISELYNIPEINNIVQSIYYVRDLINMPTDDMGPSELAKSTINLSKTLKAKVKQIVGEDLLKQNFPTIYTVGRASDDAPRLIDLRWGNKKHPKVTLVGKGVCFDSGGLDIKPANAMVLMKKDMAGAAHVLGLAQMIIQAELPVCLRVLIPAVENVISGNAYRPGDIIKSRKGITIEIGNTDAEGRVILADALTEAVSEKPDLLIDITTLTGAARIALGTELPALFSNSDDVAQQIIQHGNEVMDPVWRMPLFSLYRDSLNTPFADINNNSTDSYGGAITAALFLKEFVPDDIPWVHFDLMAWNLKPRPGRPQGGEAMALRALFSFLQARYQ